MEWTDRTITYSAPSETNVDSEERPESCVLCRAVPFFDVCLDRFTAYGLHHGYAVVAIFDEVLVFDLKQGHGLVSAESVCD